MSIRHPSLLPDVVLSVLLNREREQSPLGDGDRKRDTDRFTRQHSDGQRFRRAEIQTHRAEGTSQKAQEETSGEFKSGLFLG